MSPLELVREGKDKSWCWESKCYFFHLCALQLLWVY